MAMATLCVAAKITENLIRSGEWWFGIDDPVDLAQAFDLMGKGRAAGQRGQITEEAQLSLIKSGLQVLKEQSPDKAARAHGW